MDGVGAGAVRGALAHALGVLALAGVVALGGACGDRATPEPPESAGAARSLLLIVVDDLGRGDVGAFGGAFETPVLDRLAEEGIRLERFYSEPQCSQTRAALATGQLPWRVGIGATVVRPWEDRGLDPRSTTMAEWLRAAGFRTALVGKWHLGHARPEHHPQRHGFDHFYGHLLGAVDYFTHRRLGGLDWQRNGESLPNEDGRYTTDLIADEAIAWLGEGGPGELDEPFFLQLAFNAAHAPLRPPPGFSPSASAAGDPLRELHGAVVRSLDAAIGRVLESLDASGRLDDTLVVFLSDNGPTEARTLESLGGLRGGKGTVYEAALRTPAMVRLPVALPAGERFEGYVRATDWLPTLADALGIEAPAGPLDGRSVWSELSGRAPAAPVEPPWVFETSNRRGERHAAVIDPPWKWVRGEGAHGASHSAELFDIEADPSENTNRSAEQRDVASALAAVFEATAPERLLGPGGAAPEGFEAPADWQAALAGRAASQP